MSFVRERMRMDGRVAVVTGGGQGVGRAIALGMADAGARVVIGEINEETGPRTAVEIEELGGEALWLLTDVRKQEDLIALVAAAQEHFGRIDSMFNNAGGNFQLPAIDMSPNGFDAIVRMNLKSMFLGSQAAARTMLSEGHGGSIVSTSSVAGLRSGGNQTAVYAASKAGIMGMTRALAAEWGEHGIRVNLRRPRRRRHRGTDAQHARRPVGAFRGQPDGPHRATRGHRRGGGLPRLGPRGPYHRPGAGRGRRRQHLLTRPAGRAVARWR